HDDLAGVLVVPLELDVRGLRLRSGVDADAEAVCPDTSDLYAVAGAAQLQIRRPATLVLHLRPAAERGRQQPLPLDPLRFLVAFDGGSGERDPGVPVRDQPAFAAHAVDPAGIRTGVDNLGLVEQIEHKALVGRAALDDDCGLGHRPAQSAQRLVPVAAVGDDLRDHRV